MYGDKSYVDCFRNALLQFAIAVTQNIFRLYTHESKLHTKCAHRNVGLANDVTLRYLLISTKFYKYNMFNTLAFLSNFATGVSRYWLLQLMLHN